MIYTITPRCTPADMGPKARWSGRSCPVQREIARVTGRDDVTVGTLAVTIGKRSFYLPSELQLAISRYTHRGIPFTETFTLEIPV